MSKNRKELTQTVSRNKVVMVMVIVLVEAGLHQHWALAESRLGTHTPNRDRRPLLFSSWIQPRMTKKEFCESSILMARTY